MSVKCEWKDGKFEGCKDFSLLYAHYHEHEHFVKFSFCPFCGADIRKPEPAEPLIVKSGETIVACVGNRNFICVKNIQYWDEVCFESEKPVENVQWILDNTSEWKSFTGPNPDIVELTDEIAKLRPIVMYSTEPRGIPVDFPDPFLLIAVTVKSEQIIGIPIVRDGELDPDDVDAIHRDTIRLATAKELQAQP